MKLTKKIFKTDKLDIEVFFYPPKSNRLLLIWPCIGGTIGLYNIDYEKIINKNYGILFFHPRGHGKSQGVLNPFASAKDLYEILNILDLNNHDFYGFSHSGGCSSLLKIDIDFKKLILTAPVLDSRKSLFYMYENNKIDEFSDLIFMMSGGSKRVKEVLKDTSWLDPEYWSKKDLKNLINKDALNSPGSILENLFIPGVNAYNELEEYGEKALLIFPETDNWYPHDYTISNVSKNIGYLFINSAKDHYFTDSWMDVSGILIDNL